MASRTCSRARRTRVSTEYIANLLAEESSGEEGLDDLFTVGDLLEDKYHVDEDENNDGATISDDQTDGGLLEQNTITTDPSTEIQPG